MNYEEMKKQVALVNKVEKLYGRKLNDKEIQFLLKRGEEELNDALHIDPDMPDIKWDLTNLITLCLTATQDEYETYLAAVSKNKEKMAAILRDLADDLDPQCSCGDCDIDKEPELIDLLLDGEELELDEDELDEVIEELNDRFDSYMISIKDGKVSVIVK